MSARNVKCNKCKCYRTAEDFLKEGRQLKTCIVCRNNDKKYKLKNKCGHGLQKSQCKECGGSQVCDHNRFKPQCKDCNGNAICEHQIRRFFCKICSNPVKIAIQQWVVHSKSSDKKYNRYDANNFIDKCFLKGLVEEYTNCYYCQTEMQLITPGDTLATIERLDNSIGHIKSNCVLCCFYCNNRHKS